MNSWTLEGELRTLLGSPGDIAAALQGVGLLESGQDQYQLREVEKWRPGGAETYVYVFDVLAGSSARRLIIKAFISAAAGAGRLDVLLERRSLLKAHGVSVPDVYGVGRGLLLEEYVPWLLRDHIRSTDPDGERAMSLLVDLYGFAVVLDALNFAPLSPFADLRTDSSRVFIVDFGEDLGGPDMRRRGEPVTTQVGAWLWSLGWHLPEAALDDALRLAHERLSRLTATR